MKRKIHKGKTREVLVTIELDDQDVEPYIERAYRRVVTKIKIDGFRKGKTPRGILEQSLGKTYLLEEALESMVSEEVSKAIQEEPLEAVGLPSVEMEKLSPVVFKARIALKPLVNVEAYKTISIEEDTVEVSEEQLQLALDNLRRQIAPWEPAQRSVLFGDLVNLDVKAWNTQGDEIVKTAGIDFVPQSKTEEPYPGFSEALVGNSVGKLKEFQLSSKATSEGVRVFGNNPRFDVTINSIKAKKLAQLNEEFAKGIGDGYASLAALQDKMKNDMLDEKHRQAVQIHQQRVVEFLMNIATFELSPLLIEQEVSRSLFRQSQFIKQEKISMDQYLKSIGMTERQFNLRVKKDSEDKIKRTLALQEVAIQENLKILDEELNTEIEMLTKGSESSAQRKGMRKYLTSSSGRGDRESLRQSLLERKTIEHLAYLAKQDNVESTATPTENISA